jgi:membrane protein DedA with SNARE-associated domain
MITFNPALLKFTYPTLFLLAIPEGPLLAVFAGFLVRNGQLLVLPAYIALVLGNVIPDIFCYLLGRFGSKKNFLEKYGQKFSFIGKHFPLVEKLWSEHYRKTIILSKLAYGLSTPFLISAGLIKIPFKKFISHTIVIDLTVIAIFIGLGYMFGEAYVRIAQYIDYAGMLIACFFVAFIFAYRYITKRASATLIKMQD